MAGWDEILREIQTTPGNFDVVRRKYIHNLFVSASPNDGPSGVN